MLSQSETCQVGVLLARDNVTVILGKRDKGVNLISNLDLIVVMLEFDVLEESVNYGLSVLLIKFALLISLTMIYDRLLKGQAVKLVLGSADNLSYLVQSEEVLHNFQIFNKNKFLHTVEESDLNTFPIDL